MKIGGEAGIRTLGTLTGTPHFECGAFDHSATSPVKPRGCCTAGQLERPLSEGSCACQGSACHHQQSAYIDVMITRPIPVHVASQLNAPAVSHARFAIGEVVRHRLFPFRGVVFDIDPIYANSDEWYEAIPEEIRPAKDQPFYHLLAENAESNYVAYVSQQNLVPDEAEGPVDHPAIDGLFDGFIDGRYRLRREHRQ